MMGILIVVLACAGINFYKYYSSLIPMPLSPSDVKKFTYEDLYKSLSKAGYTNINTENLRDLDYQSLDKENRVTQMKVDGSIDYSKGKKYTPDIAIRITYHTSKLIYPPSSAKELKGMQYKKVKEKFEEKGFGNIETVGEKDFVLTRWMNEEGEVKSVSIGGDKEYSTISQYRVDEKIVIKYHTKK